MKKSLAVLVALAVSLCVFPGCETMKTGRNPWAAPPKKKTLAERWDEMAKKSAETRLATEEAKKQREEQSQQGEQPSQASAEAVVAEEEASEKTPEAVEESVPAEKPASDTTTPPVPAPAGVKDDSPAVPAESATEPAAEPAKEESISAPVPAKDEPAPAPVPAKEPESAPVPAPKPTPASAPAPVAVPAPVKVSETKEFAEVVWVDLGEKIVVAERFALVPVVRGEIFAVYGKDDMALHGFVKLSAVDGKNLGFTLVSGNPAVGDRVAKPNEALRREMKEKLK